MARYSTPAWVDESNPAIEAAALTALGEAVELAQHPYGVCDTLASVAAKTVTIQFSGTLSLFDGLTVRILFPLGNVADNPTLNVNGTGDIPIGGFDSGGKMVWDINCTMEFTYHNNTWWVNGYNAFLRGQVLTYTGTGSYGQANPNSLTFGFSPLIVVVHRNGLFPSSNQGPFGYESRSWYNSFVYTRGQSLTQVNGGQVNFELHVHTLTWYGSYYDSQLNEQGVTYFAYGIGA